MEIYLLRHPKILSPKGICYGFTDFEATASQEEVDKIKTYLPNEFITYSSPLVRCKKLAKSFSSDPILDSDLKEMNFGEWENRYWSDIPKEEVELWTSDIVNKIVPGGESFLQVKARTENFLKRLGDKTYLVVTHSGVIRTFLNIFTGVPLENSFRFKIEFLSLTKITQTDEGIHVHYVNKI
ncbi:MAG: histidine phosphatase family protein [Leptospiraceae bacterium]|nr:histidine phosphatase family protein [Leptospiraceae bacterium]